MEKVRRAKDQDEFDRFMVGAAPDRSSRGDLKHVTDTEKPGFGRAFLFQGSVSRGRGAVSGGSTGRRAGGRRSPKTAGLGAARGAVIGRPLPSC